MPTTTRKRTHARTAQPTQLRMKLRMTPERWKVIDYLLTHGEGETYRIEGPNVGGDIKVALGMSKAFGGIMARLASEQIVKRKVDRASHRTKALELGKVGLQLAARREERGTESDTAAEARDVPSDIRQHSTTVRRYLDLVRDNDGAGAGKTAERTERALARLDVRIERATSSFERLRLAQQRRDLVRELERLQSTPDIESAFIVSAPIVAHAYGIEYQTWRDFGVEPSVLKAAGIR